MTMPALATDTETITIQGTVPSSENINITPTADYQSLDLRANYSAGYKVADVNERCNNKNGYTVTLSSANSGKFVGVTSGNTDTISYTVKYNGTEYDLATGTKTVTDVNDKTTGTGVTKELQVVYDGTSLWVNADTYRDTMTFTLAAK
jgi:hypothetical protein